MLSLYIERNSELTMPLDIYIFARYFGTGVIAATAFIHFSDPAYGKIASFSCVGSSGNWAIYSWCLLLYCSLLSSSFGGCYI
jgi:zinc transporter 1/2/3